MTRWALAVPLRPGGVLLFAAVSPTDLVCKHVHDLRPTAIIAGCSSTTWRPTDNISRDQTANFLVNASDSPSDSLSTRRGSVP